MKDFIEITAQFENIDEIDEIMLHINEKGKIVKAYCWVDGIPQMERYNEITGEYYVKYCKTKKCNNSLFLDLSLNWVIKHLHMMYISIQDESEIDNDTNLAKAILKYKNLTVDLD